MGRGSARAWNPGMPWSIGPRFAKLRQPPIVGTAAVTTAMPLTLTDFEREHILAALLPLSGSWVDREAPRPG